MLRRRVFPRFFSEGYRYVANRNNPGVCPADESIASDDALQPHEVTTKEQGITPHGTEVERTTSVVGKSLN